MNSGRLVAIASALISLAALAIAISEFEGIMTVIALFSLVFGSVASKRCSAKTNLFILAAAIATLACTAVSVVALGPEQMVDKDVMDKVHWFYIMGLLHAVPIVPMAFASFIIIASVTGASYNWAVVGGLSPFVALGILVPGYVLEYVFQGIGDLYENIIAACRAGQKAAFTAGVHAYHAFSRYIGGIHLHGADKADFFHRSHDALQRGMP